MHLGLYLDKKLNFSQHINIKISKANKETGIIKRLSHILPRKSLLTVYKSFSRPHLDYCDVIYDQPNNKSFCTKTEQIQYNATLAITDAIRGTSEIKLYKELGLESLRYRRWFRRLCTFFKIKIHSKPRLNRAEGQKGHQLPPPTPPKKSFLLMCPFLLMSPLNVLFLKEVTENVH